jgi:hypothetical protein
MADKGKEEDDGAVVEEEEEEEGVENMVSRMDRAPWHAVEKERIRREGGAGQLSAQCQALTIFFPF